MTSSEASPGAPQQQKPRRIIALVGAAREAPSAAEQARADSDRRKAA